MGHLGLLPQTATKYTVQGKTKEDAHVLLEDAKALQEAGCFSIVFEMVVADTMKRITPKQFLFQQLALVAERTVMDKSW